MRRPQGRAAREIDNLMVAQSVWEPNWISKVPVPKSRPLADENAAARTY
jgi:hypothetical protein